MAKRIAFIMMIIVGTVISSCNRKVYQITGDHTYSMMYNGINRMLSVSQLDSVIGADNLPRLDRWLTDSYRDFETGETIVLRTMYMDNDTASLSYRAELIGNDSVFLVKRVMLKTLNEENEE